jgi:hypothetical protein
MGLLVQHLATATGIVLQETDYSKDPKAGDFIHLATKDPFAKPGTMRLILGSNAEALKVYQSLHGQTVQVGSDLVGIEVVNDVINSVATPGNRARNRV